MTSWTQLVLEFHGDDEALLAKLTLESIPGELRHHSPYAPLAPIVELPLAVDISAKYPSDVLLRLAASDG